MALHELTFEQQSFAEENHNLVYAFLRDKKLPYDKFYDIIVFGYLRAVRQYLNRDDLRQRYSFGTIAYRKMTDDLYKHFKMQSKPSRKAVTVSLESRYSRCGSLTLADVIPDPEPQLDKLDAVFFWEEISCLLNHEQTKILCMKADGYNNREIAASQKCRPSYVDSVIAEIQFSVLDMCLV